MKTKVCIGLILGITALAVANSCTKGSEDKLGGGAAATCDTVDMKYTEDVVPILVANCYTCHGNGSTAGSGGILLEGYSNLQKWAANGYLVGNVTHAPGYVPMPYGLPALPSCEVNTIVDWVNNGYQNN